MYRPLVTFAIVSYNNYKYIKEALNSVFIQTYPNIQLIISNDASDDFDEEDLELYLNENKTDNIKQIIIHNHEYNVGTVKNVKYCRDNADGEYIMYMAADDALYDKDVLDTYVDRFESLGEEAMVVCSKTAMCGHELEEIIDYFPDKERISIIKNCDSHSLFSRLSHEFIIPTTSCCYRKKLFDIVGDYSEDYFIIEDAPLYIRMARMGIKFNWIDDHIGARHRDGGISHGNTLNLSESYRKYRYDEILIFEKEILPYKDIILKDDYKKMIKKWEYVNNSYFQLFILPNLSKSERLKYTIKHIPSILKKILKRSKEKILELSFDEYFYKDLVKATAYSVIMFFIFFSKLFKNIVPKEINDIIIICTGNVFLLFAILLWGLIILRILYRLYLSIKYVIIGK